MTASEPPRVLIANRGEIAVRVIRAVHAFGWSAVAVYSDADADSRWVAMADEAAHVGPSPTGKSYLNTDVILEAARQTGADYIHPGYGFLSESAKFARRVTEDGLTWIGPPAQVIETMGDKARARATALRAGIPVVPGTDILADAPQAERAAAQLGYPVLVKAAAGGGGRGIRVVSSPAELADTISTAQAEANSSFGSPDVYLEKAVTGARHVEVQVLADGYGTVLHAFERDCSVQRRRQKLLEEAPAPGLSPDLRRAMTAAAVRLTEEIGYRGAGTVEFLVEGDKFYFIEMNTRIQVEHPITEQVTGLDLVIEQLRVAAGRPLSMQQEDIALSGAAIEFRINAEDPAQDFFPSPGQITRFDHPGGPGVRVDSGVVAGGQIAPYYDSLLAKVIVHGRDREEALARSTQALRELTIKGVQTTRKLHLDLLADPELRAGGVTTTWFERWLAARTSYRGRTNGRWPRSAHPPR